MHKLPGLSIIYGERARAREWGGGGGGGGRRVKEIRRETEREAVGPDGRIDGQIDRSIYK